MQKLVVMNAKGGCGKSTIATNLVSYYAAHGYRSALFDHDPQGSSMQWLQRRPKCLPEIYGVAAYDRGTATTKAWRMRIPPEIERVVVDTPAGLKGYELQEYLKGADAIIIPVLPSSIDINATANFLRELILVVKVKVSETPIYIIPNRVKPRTRTFKALENFLSSLNMPLMPHLRDTVNYIHAAELGMGIHELPVKKIEADQTVWDAMMLHIDPELGDESNIKLTG